MVSIENKRIYVTILFLLSLIFSIGSFVGFMLVVVLFSTLVAINSIYDEYEGFRSLKKSVIRILLAGVFW